MANVNNTPIPDLQTAWEGYSGLQVEALIKRYLSSLDTAVRNKIGYLHRGQEKEQDNNYHLRGFASEADFNEWNSDPETYASLVLADVALPDTGGGGSTTSYIVNLYTSSNTSSIVTTDNKVVLKIRFTSQVFNPATQTTTDTGNTGTLTIQRRGTASAQWVTVGTKSITSIDAANTDEYIDVDISSMLSDGNQQVRVICKDDDNGLNTRYLTFASIIKTTLALKFVSDWWRPYNNGTIPLSYRISGAVNKTLHIRITGEGGTGIREISDGIGSSVYQETPYTLTLRDTASDSVKVITHGIHEIEAWLSVNGTDIESEHIVSHVMVVTDNSDTSPHLIVNNAVTSVANYTQATLFEYALFNPAGTPMDVTFLITNYGGSEEFMRITENNVASGDMAHSFTNVLEIESENETIDAYVHFLSGATQLADNLGITIDNRENFAPTADADFVLNPKVRNNGESNPARIINDVTGAVVPSTFTGFAFNTDGWVQDSDNAKCLFVPAGRNVAIDYESYEDFKQDGANSSLTIELDFKTDNVNDEASPILRMCSYGNNDTPLGFEMKPMEACFMTQSKQVRLDQDIMFQEGVRTHVAINIVNNLSGAGINYVRIFVNGTINREFIYTNEDSFIQYVSGVKSSQGIRIGDENADIYIYGIRVYRKALSATNVRQDYMSSLPTTEQKRSYRDANDITGDDGQISFSKTYDKYNTMVWTGVPMSYANKATGQTSGDLAINIIGDPDHSGTINNMTCKGQGSSSKGYWKWNQQYGFNGNSVWTDGNGNVRGKFYQLTSDTPNATKLVAKLNWASSMQSHKLGSTALYTDLWRLIVRDADTPTGNIARTEGFENVRVSVIEKPFFLFVRDTAESEPVFYGLVTFGPGKGDKPTFGYDKNRFPDYLMVEGSDNGMPLTEHRVPWMDDEVTYDNDEESDFYETFVYAGASQWDFGLGNLNMIDYFKEAFNFAFLHSPNIKPYVGKYSQMLSDAVAGTLDRNYMYWVTQADTANGSNQYDLYRWCYINETMVNASATKSGGNYVKLNIRTQTGVSPTGNDWDAINQLFINARAAMFRANMENYWDLTDTLFTMQFCKLIAASDNRCKNTYQYLDPVSHIIGFNQDDLDTIKPTDNVGRKTKPYYVEEHDLNPAGATYWNGTNNAFYNMMEIAYPSELMAMMNKILTKMAELAGSVQACLERYYFAVQRYFPSVAYNEIARLLYEEASVAMAEGRYSNATPPITQSLGDQLQCELQWWKRRLVYMSSYAGYGEFVPRGNNCLMFRSILTTEGGNPTYSFDLIPHQWIYPAGSVGQSPQYGRGNTRPVRVPAGQLFTLDGMQADGNTDICIYGADYYKSIGDFGNKSLGEVFNLLGKRLEEFVITPDSNDVLQFRPTSIATTASQLRVLNLENWLPVKNQDGSYPSVGGINLTALTKLVTLKLKGTRLTSVTLPATDTLKTVTLPATLEQLEVTAQPGITSLTLEGASNLSRLRVLGNANIDTYSLALRAFTDNAPLNEVEFEDINWSSVPVALVQKLSQSAVCRITGYIDILEPSTTPAVTFAIKQQLIAQWGDIDDDTTPNPLVINYRQNSLLNIEIAGESYIKTAGVYQFEVVPNSEYANDFKKITWGLSGVNDDYATLDTKTGTLNVVQISSVSLFATISVVVEKVDGTQLTASMNVGLYDRVAEVGDYVYADGSFSNVYNPRKTVVGKCFYINPNDPTDRRMVGCHNLMSDHWGLYNNASSGVSGLETDGALASGYPTVYNLPSANPEGMVDYSASGISGNISDSNYRNGDDFIDFSSGAIADIKLREITLATLNIVAPSQFLVEQDVVVGSRVPSGRYNTLLIMKHRNYILDDGNIGYAKPKAGGGISETTSLNNCISAVIAANENKNQYRQFYYPAASRCFAYEPTDVIALKEGEVLSDKFKAHKWYLPSCGELARLYWYHSKGYTAGVDNAIFADIVARGLFDRFSANYYWSSTEGSATNAWPVDFSNGNVIGIYKAGSSIVRPVCAF